MKLVEPISAHEYGASRTNNIKRENTCLVLVLNVCREATFSCGFLENSFLYASYGKIDTANPRSYSISRVWESTFNRTHITLVLGLFTLWISRFPNKSPSSSCACSMEWVDLCWWCSVNGLGFWICCDWHTLWMWPLFPQLWQASFLNLHSLAVWVFALHR